jgi:hypothetical protein
LTVCLSPFAIAAIVQRIVKALVDAHGDNIEAMWRDRKLNSMQHTVAVRVVPDAPNRLCVWSAAVLFEPILIGPLVPPSQVLRNMVRSFLAFPKLAAGGTGARDFRAPKKSLGR